MKTAIKEVCVGKNGRVHIYTVHDGSKGSL